MIFRDCTSLCPSPYTSIYPHAQLSIVLIHQMKQHVFLLMVHTVTPVGSGTDQP